MPATGGGRGTKTDEVMPLGSSQSALWRPCTDQSSKSCSKRERKEARQRRSHLSDPEPLNQALAKGLVVSKT